MHQTRENEQDEDDDDSSSNSTGPGVLALVRDIPGYVISLCATWVYEIFFQCYAIYQNIRYDAA